jgi:hypothetical protein
MGVLGVTHVTIQINRTSLSRSKFWSTNLYIYLRYASGEKVTPHLSFVAKRLHLLWLRFAAPPLFSTPMPPTAHPLSSLLSSLQTALILVSSAAADRSAAPPLLLCCLHLLACLLIVQCSRCTLLPQRALWGCCSAPGVLPQRSPVLCCVPHCALEQRLILYQRRRRSLLQQILLRSGPFRSD